MRRQAVSGGRDTPSTASLSSKPMGLESAPVASRRRFMPNRLAAASTRSERLQRCVPRLPDPDTIMPTIKILPHHELCPQGASISDGPQSPLAKNMATNPPINPGPAVAAMPES